uniref:Metalloendopeptidase n=1 Tax=Parastrongyloides trichosuri TaxID=131310 RepID=A0A0N4ZXH0_PARTI
MHIIIIFYGFVSIKKIDNNCTSEIGKPIYSKPQKIVLAKHCEITMTVIHETMHALGVRHEMVRFYRDKYIYVLYNNIPFSNQYLYQIETVSEANTFGLKYDFGSIMDYSSLEDNAPAFRPKD